MIRKQTLGQMVVASVLWLILCLVGVDLGAADPKPESKSPAATAQPASHETASPNRVTVGGGQVQNSPDRRAYTAAVFVANRLAPEHQKQSNVWTDLLTAQVTSLGFTLVNPEDAQKTMATATGQPSDLDQVVDQESSRLALARNLGVDYLLIGGLTSYETKTVTTQAYGVTTKKTVYTLTVTYKIAERNLGGSLKAGQISVSDQKQESAGLEIDYDPMGSLLRQAAEQVAAKLKSELDQKALPKPETLQLAQFTVKVRVQGFSVPNIVKDKEGQYVISDQPLSILANGATIVLDGAAIGTAPGLFKGPVGMHKLRVSRDGCRPWQENVSVNDQAQFEIDLQLTDESIARWQDMTAFLQALVIGQKLTDAQVEVLQGYAQMLRQSGFKVDQKTDIKVDAKALPDVHKHQSIWSQ